MRYYHSLVDTQLLSTGSGYENLPKVVIIIILPYDPFDKDRMVYTIENHCTEDPTIPYNDGAKKIICLSIKPQKSGHSRDRILLSVKSYAAFSAFFSLVGRTRKILINRDTT